MSGGREPVRATFWLLQAPDALAQQSHRAPDGTGLGAFAPDGSPRVSKQPIAAFEDQQFATEAREEISRTFVAHVRYASTGARTPANTHPFEQRGRLMAHNGVIEDLPSLEAHLAGDMNLVSGDTDSERFFALITREIGLAGGEVGAGITRAAQWVADHLPLFAINLVLITPDGLWALRYPDTHELWVLERPAGGHQGESELEHASPRRRIRVHSEALAQRPAVIVASERMDDDPGWRLMDPGELLSVDASLRCQSVPVLEGPPRHLLTLADLGEQARSSQQPTGPGGAPA
jgi:predicted glutamine amidotransferase